MSEGFTVADFKHVADGTQEGQFSIGEKKRVSGLADLDPIYRDLLDRPITATLGITGPDGRVNLTQMWFDYEGDKILVQPNGVPASEVAAAETGGTRGAAVRARYGLEGEIVIGFVGLFLDWHRLDWMVEAFASLRPAERGITLMMVGDGPSESFAEVGRRLGVDAKILRTGRVDRAAIPEHLAAMDIGVIPHSNAFRSPIKLFEYMAQSLAVAASATEPIEMVIEDGCNGVLFDTSGPESMGAAFERLVGDPERRRALGARARQDVIERYTWEHNAEEVIATLRRRGRLRDPTDA